MPNTDSNPLPFQTSFDLMILNESQQTPDVEGAEPEPACTGSSSTLQLIHAACPSTPLPTLPLSHGYGGFSASEAQDVRERSDASPNVGGGWERCEGSAVLKAKWARAKCVPRMTNVFVQMREAFLIRDKKIA